LAIDRARLIFFWGVNAMKANAFTGNVQSVAVYDAGWTFLGSGWQCQKH
jgi:hypothetical protein